MTIEELKQAYAAGAKIQLGVISMSTGEINWFDLEEPCFDDDAFRYRVKP